MRFSRSYTKRSFLHTSTTVHLRHSSSDGRISWNSGFAPAGSSTVTVYFTVYLPLCCTSTDALSMLDSCSSLISTSAFVSSTKMGTVFSPSSARMNEPRCVTSSKVSVTVCLSGTEPNAMLVASQQSLSFVAPGRANLMRVARAAVHRAHLHRRVHVRRHRARLRPVTSATRMCLSLIFIGSTAVTGLEKS